MPGAPGLPWATRSWILVTAGASGTGSGTVSYTVAANPGAARSGTLTVADQTSPATSRRSWSTRPRQLATTRSLLRPRTLACLAGPVPSPSPVEAWCSWTATSNDLPWLTVTSGSPGNGNGSVGYSVAALSAGARAGTITIGDRTFTVSQPFLTDRELAHGADAWQSLAAQGGVAQVDYYRLAQRPYSSYEVAVDGDSGDVQPVAARSAGLGRRRCCATSQAIGTGAARSLRWRNTPRARSRHRRSGSAAAAAAARTAVPTTRTGFAATRRRPRSPASTTRASQLTVLILQNPADYTITGTAYFWSGAGALLASSDFTLNAKQTLVLEHVVAGGARRQGRDDHDRPRRPLRGPGGQGRGARAGDGLQLRLAPALEAGPIAPGSPARSVRTGYLCAVAVAASRNASRTSACCSARWTLSRPDAGEAESARPT